MPSSSSTTTTFFTQGSVAVGRRGVNARLIVLWRVLPDIADWLSASWTDFRRRWGVLMAVAAVGGAATLAGVLLPLLPAGIATLLGAGSPWIVWGTALLAGMLIGMWLSTWGQAALVRAAAADEGASDALAAGWRQTPAFAWVLSLAMLAAAGGLVLLVIPGLLLCSLFFFAPFYQLSGESDALDALELSFSRVIPVLWPVSFRLALACLIAAAPSWIPWIGWLIGPLWAPFALVACARLAADLKTLTPSPEKKPWMAPAIIALSTVFVLAFAAASLAAARRIQALRQSYASGELAQTMPDELTARSLLAVLQGKGTDEDNQRALDYAIRIAR
jgi:HAMP domain-containing protein